MMKTIETSWPVLLLDDDDFILKTNTHALLRVGFTNVHAVNNAAAALDILRGAKVFIELVVLDLNMPGFDGIEFIRALSRICYTGGLILVSGEDEHSLSLAVDLARARQLRVYGSISKPLKADDLRTLLDPRQLSCQSPKSKFGRSSDADVVTKAELSSAIKLGNVKPYFQPKIDVKTGMPVGVEMLARWTRAGNNIPPDIFIPVAEDSQLIDPLTLALLSKALVWVKQWQQAWVDLHLAINVSMNSLHNIDFADRLLAVVREADLAVSLKVEVTESRLREHLLAPLDNLLRLRLNKVEVSIDDFGTGASNLAQLRDLPFTELKLDSDFIQGARENSRTRAILRHTLELAKQIGMTTVAEGVEEYRDWKMVKELGFDLAQGCFLAAPMPGSAVANWTQQWRREQYASMDLSDQVGRPPAIDRLSNREIVEIKYFSAKNVDTGTASLGVQS